MIQGYLKEIEELRAKLLESEAMCQQLRKASSRSPARMPLSPHVAMTGELLIKIAPYIGVPRAVCHIRKIKVQGITVDKSNNLLTFVFTAVIHI
jgi:kinesin family protein 4/21/27